MVEIKTGTVVVHKEYGRGIALTSTAVMFPGKESPVVVDDRQKLFCRGDVILYRKGSGWNPREAAFYDAITHNHKEGMSKYTVELDGIIIYVEAIRHISYNKKVSQIKRMILSLVADRKKIDEEIKENYGMYIETVKYIQRTDPSWMADVGEIKSIVED